MANEWLLPDSGMKKVRKHHGSHVQTQQERVDRYKKAKVMPNGLIEPITRAEFNKKVSIPDNTGNFAYCWVNDSIYIATRTPTWFSDKSGFENLFNGIRPYARNFLGSSKQYGRWIVVDKLTGEKIPAVMACRPGHWVIRKPREIRGEVPIEYLMANNQLIVSQGAFFHVRRERL